MREIKFCGKSIESCEWIYGYYYRGEIDPSKHFIICMESYNDYEVDPETIGQYIELHDKNDKEIFEKDIVKFVGGTTSHLSCGNYESNKHEIGTVLIVKKLKSGFTLQKSTHIKLDSPNLVGNVSNYDLWNHHRSLEIIGNIHDNPELIDAA